MSTSSGNTSGTGTLPIDTPAANLGLGYSQAYGGLDSDRTQSGNNWTVENLPELEFDGADVAVLSGANETVYFTSDGMGGYTADFFVKAHLFKSTSPVEYTYVDMKGKRHVFGSDGKLTKLIDPCSQEVSSSKGKH